MKLRPCISNKQFSYFNRKIVKLFSPFISVILVDCLDLWVKYNHKGKILFYFQNLVFWMLFSDELFTIHRPVHKIFDETNSLTLKKKLFSRSLKLKWKIIKRFILIFYRSHNLNKTVEGKYGWLIPRLVSLKWFWYIFYLKSIKSILFDLWCFIFIFRLWLLGMRCSLLKCRKSYDLISKKLWNISYLVEVLWNINICFSFFSDLLPNKLHQSLIAADEKVYKINFTFIK